MSCRTIYSLSRELNVEEVKKVILEEKERGTGAVYFEYRGVTLTPFALVMKNFDQFGIDFLNAYLVNMVLEPGTIIMAVQNVPGEHLGSVIQVLVDKIDSLLLNVSLLGVLLDKRIDVETLTILMERWRQAGVVMGDLSRFLSKCETVAIARYLVSLGAKPTPEYANFCPIEVVRYFCQECGMDINEQIAEGSYRGNCILATRVYKLNGAPSFEKVVGCLLALGADPNLPAPLFGGKTVKEWYGPTNWEARFGGDPFVATLDALPGTQSTTSALQWRFEFISDTHLRAQCLTKEEGLVERRLGYLRLPTGEIYVAMGDEMVKVK